MDAIQMASPAFLGLVISILRILAILLMWFVLFRTASEVLLAASEGETRAPAFRDIDAADGLALRHIGLWLLATVLLAAAAATGQRAWLVAGMLAAVVVLPAATILLTLTNRYHEALNPTLWWRLIRRIGLDDYALAGGLLVAAGGGYFIVDTLVRLLPGQALWGSAAMFAYWAWAVLAWFFLAGRLVHVHREDLHLEPPPAKPERAPEAPVTATDPEALWAEIRTRGGTPAMHAALARALEREGDETRLIEHARLHIAALLLSFDDPNQAVDRAAAMLARDPDFVLTKPGDTYALIRAAVADRQHWLVVRLCAAFLKAFPNSPRADEVRLTGAEAGAEAGAPPPEARAWLEQLKTARLAEDQRERLRSLLEAY